MGTRTGESIMRILFIVIVSLNLCHAQDIAPIRQGEPAPFDGYVIDKSMEKKVRQIKEDHKKQKELNVKMEELGVIQQSQVTVYKEQLTTLEKDNSTLRTNNNLSSIVYFGLGVLATSLAAYGAMKTLGK